MRIWPQKCDQKERLSLFDIDRGLFVGKELTMPAVGIQRGAVATVVVGIGESLAEAYPVPP